MSHWKLLRREALAAGVKLALGSGDDAEAELAVFFRRGEERWAGLGLDRQEVVRHLAPKLAGVASLSSLCAEDLYLALGCARAAPLALDRYNKECVEPLCNELTQSGRFERVSGELAAAVRERVLVARDEAPRIALYAGRAPLSAWTRAVAVRLAVAASQKLARERLDGSLPCEAGASGRLELTFVQQRYRVPFRDAFVRALETLTAKERYLLQLCVLQNLALEQVGRLYGVNKSTVSRWLGAARERVLEETKRHLAEAERLSPGELNSLVRVLHSQLDVSLTALLGDEGRGR